MDALRAQVTVLTDELNMLKQELVNTKAAHAALHQQSTEGFVEQRTRLETMETKMSTMPTTKGGHDSQKPLIEPKQVVVSEFAGSMSDGRARFLEWCEKVHDRVALFEDNLVQAMTEAEKYDTEINAEQTTKMGVTPFASRQLHGFLKD